MNWAARFRNAIFGTASWLEFLAGWILFVVAVGVTMNAIARYGFGRDLSIVTEVGGFIFLIVTFMALTSAYFAGQHVSVELLETIAPKRVVSAVYGYVVPFLAIVFMVGMTVASAIMTYRYFHNGRVTVGLYPMPFWVFMAVVPVGSALYSLALLADLIRRVRGDKDGAPHTGQSTDDGL